MNPWFRFYSKFITDPDIEELSFEDQRHFVFVLCMKCSGLLDKDFGSDIEKRERAISRRLGLQGEAFTFAKQRLIDARLIDGSWQPRSWSKLQFKSDHDTAERQRRSRANRRVTRMSRDSHALEQNRTEQNKEDSSPVGEQFGAFWDAYPRKVGKLKALSAWKTKQLDAKAEEIIEHLRVRVTSDAQWLAGVKYIPHPTTWLNRGGWLDVYERAAERGFVC